MEEQKRPTYYVRITGNDWDKDGMPIAIDTEDQCCGVMAYATDGEVINGRIYGEFKLADLASVIYMLKNEFGAEAFEMAARAADAVIEGEANVGSGEAETDTGSDELRGVPEGGEGLLEGMRGHGDTKDNDGAGTAGSAEADEAVL